MAQHDYNIANQSGAAFRADVNNALAAIVSQNSGPNEPSVTYAYQWWADTANGLLKIRNAANNGWITIGTLTDVGLGLLGRAGGTMTGALLLDDAANTPGAPALAFDGDANTGIYRSAADRLNIAAGGSERIEFGTTEVVLNDGGDDVDFRIEGDTNPDLFKIDAGLDQVQVANLNGGPLAGMRNRIINGDMRFYQRNAAATANGVYSLDRWRLGLTSSGAVSTSQSTTTPTAAVAGTAFSNSLLVDITTADTSIAASDFLSIEQPIEGFNVGDLGFGAASASSVTVSFWIRCTTTGTYCVSIANSAGTRSYVSTYTVAAANTWERKVITIPGDTSGTWLTDNGTGLILRFAFAAGSTFQTTADSWQTGNFLATSAQANLLSSAANEAYITGVQLEPGTVATPFERRSYGLELALCQRYYEVLGPVAVMFPWSNTTQIIRGQGQFAVTKRVAPTVTMGTKPNGVGTLSASSIDQYGCMFTGSGNASDVVTYTGNTASAEL